jgi:F-type H+-transporting ATPase subunit a
MKNMHIKMLLYSPLEQFIIIKPLFLFNISMLPSICYNIMVVYLIIIFIVYSCKNVTHLGFIQYTVLKLFLLVKDVLKKNLKIKKQIYILHFFILFLFILLSNLLGLFPYSFSLTSHFSVTLFLSYSFFFTMIIIGIKRNGLRAVKFLFPVKVPYIIVPLLVIVELISFLIRPLSLAIRLSANMLAGHILLKILATVT